MPVNRLFARFWIRGNISPPSTSKSLRFVIVVDGLLPSEGRLVPHPELHPWHKRMNRAGKLWANCASKTAVEWYLWATKSACSPAAFLASRTAKIPADTKQCWIASPYHAVVARDHVDVAPESSFDWDEQQALRLAALLNPLLEECDMILIPAGPMLLACCNKAWDVDVPGFAAISGGRLPDRQPPGKDAGDMMRLLSEIQMALAQDTKSSVSGLWFWGATGWPANHVTDSFPAVMTDESALSSVTNSELASFVVTSAAGAGDMLKANKPPRFWMLAGGGQCVLLDCRALPRLGRNVWKFGQSLSLDKIQERVFV